MLMAAIDREVSNYVNERIDIVDEHGRRLVVRNGSLSDTGTGNPDRNWPDRRHSVVSPRQAITRRSRSVHAQHFAKVPSQDKVH